MEFEQSIYEGLKYEEQFEAWCYLRGIKLKDRRNEFVGIDYDVTLPTGQIIQVDIKRYSKPFYLAIEDLNDVRTQRPGWFYKSKATFIVYVGCQRLVWLRLSDCFRRWYRRHKNQYYQHVNQPTHHNGSVWQSAFRFVPIEDIKQWIIEKKLTNIKEAKGDK